MRNKVIGQREGKAPIEALRVLHKPEELSPFERVGRAGRTSSSSSNQLTRRARNAQSPYESPRNWQL
jgi:hypothetical protein